MSLFGTTIAVAGSSADEIILSELAAILGGVCDCSYAQLLKDSPVINFRRRGGRMGNRA